jgi:Protein of unknown function (DUF3631)
MNDEGVATQVAAGMYKPGGYNPNGQSGAALFDEIAALIRRFVIIGKHELVAFVAFIVHCHAIDAFYTTPRIKITSPEENCGKTLLAIDIGGHLLPVGSILSVSITPSALYRSLTDSTPAVVMDEFDNGPGRKGAAIDSEVQSLLQAVLNEGYRRGAKVYRTHPRTHERVEFPVFAPVVVVGIRPDLSRAFETRTIPIEMQRALPDAQLEVFEWKKKMADDLEALRNRIAEWAKQNLTQIETTEPKRPDGIIGRKAEIWVPLLTVAEVAGGLWPKRLREAATVLGLDASPDSDSISNQLLADTRDVFGDRERIWSGDLTDGLNALVEERRWHTWNDGEGIKPIDFFHRVIKRYRLHKSKDIRIGDQKAKGYEREWFEDAWKRYLGPPKDDDDGESEKSDSEAVSPPTAATPEGLPETPETSLIDKGIQSKSNPRQSRLSEALDPLQDNGCLDVSGKNPDTRPVPETRPESPDTLEDLGAHEGWDVP